jgi:epoxide hydrolase-like predicted phosphatase
MNNRNIKAIIWDMGGVILRTEDPAPREALAKSLGTSRERLEWLVFVSPSANLATIGEISVQDHFKEVARILSLDQAGLEKFIFEFWLGDRVDQTLLEEIRSLRKDYKIAMLSNAWDNTRQVLTTDFPCLDAFDLAIFSAEVKLAKPQPEIYHLMLNRLGVKPEEAVFIDDFTENVAAAVELGIHGIRFRSRDQALTEVKEILDGKE